MQEESDFGRGLVICLVKFAEHSSQWLSIKRNNEEMRSKHPNLFSESNAVHMLFNAASDHLYEIEVPKSWKGSELDLKVKELREFALKIGHSFSNETWTEADVIKGFELCLEIALLIDKKLGLSPLKGRW